MSMRSVLFAASASAFLSACPLDLFVGGPEADAGPADGCDEGLAACGEACVDLARSAAHCGACDDPCADDEVCVEGGCVRDGAAPDAGPGPGPSPDGGVAPVIGGCVASECPETPRPVAPLSTSRVTSDRPTLRWVLGPTADGARVDLCRDRAFTVDCASFEATGTSARPSALGPGVWFWRVTERTGGALGAQGPIWSLVVGVRAANVDASFGTLHDVDGDALSDVVVGAPMADAAYVFRGSSAGFAATPTTTLAGEPSSFFGGAFQMDVVGDVNGDGYADLVVGAPQGQTPDSPGAAHLFYGTAAGLLSTPVTLRPPASSGPFPGFGVGVAEAGDVNGDGYSDVLVGEDEGNGGGAFHLYLGGPTGLGATASAIFEVPSFRGQLLDGLGDVDGDGFADVAFGGIEVVTILHGSRAGLRTDAAATLVIPPDTARDVVAAGDVNGDGHADLLVGANGGSVAGENAVLLFLGGPDGISPTPATTWSGAYTLGLALAGAGDLNGDGYADVAMNQDHDKKIYYGGPAGIDASAATTLVGAGYGELRMPGDLDGDGYGDLVVSEVGSVRVHLGAATGISSTPAVTWTDDPQTVFGVLALAPGPSTLRDARLLRRAARLAAARL